MKKRCFLIGTSLQRTAVSAHFQALARELVRRGHEAVIIAPPGGGEPDSDHTQFRVHLWPSARPTHFADAAFLWRLIGRYQPDCLIANFAPVNWMCLVGWLRRVHCRTAWYHTPTGMIDTDGRIPRWKLRFFRLRKRFFYRLSTQIVGVSNSAMSDAVSSFGIPPQKCKVFYNSLRDPGGRQQENRRDGLVVCVGRLYPTKGQDILIRAAALLMPSQGNLTIEFIGEGPNRQRLEQLVAELGVSDRVIFRGSLPYAEVLQRLGNAALSVVPSRVDAGALTLIESLSLGTPVVATRVGSTSELLSEDIEGLLFDENSPKSLAEKIELLLRDRLLRERIGAMGRQRFLQNFEQSRAVAAQANWLEHITVRTDEPTAGQPPSASDDGQHISRTEERPSSSLWNLLT